MKIQVMRNRADVDCIAASISNKIDDKLASAQRQWIQLIAEIQHHQANV